MIERIIERGKTSGRSDDNHESLKKRFATFNEESVPIVTYFEQKGKVRKINALRGIDEVSADVEKAFKGYIWGMGVIPYFYNDLEFNKQQPII